MPEQNIEMNDEDQLDGGAAPPSGPSAEAKAAAIGWAPKEQWRGDPAAWVDAAEFIRRGETLLPILRSTNRKLETKVSTLESTNAQLAAQLEELRGSMDEFVGVQRDMLNDRLTQQRADLRRQLREARDSGDEAAIDRLEESLDENRGQQAKLKEQLEEPPKPKGAPPAPPPNPAFLAWCDENTWFGGKSVEEQRRSALAMQLGKEAGAARLQGKAFFDYIDEELAKAAGHAPQTRKVENGRPSGGGGGGGGGGNPLANLPADAQAQAKADAKRFVGPNKVFKTNEAYFAHFAKQYGEE